MKSHKVITDIKDATCENCIYSYGSLQCGNPDVQPPREDYLTLNRNKVVNSKAWCPDGRWLVPPYGTRTPLIETFIGLQRAFAEEE